MSLIDDIVGFIVPAAPVVKQQAKNIDAAVKQSVEASPTWTYPSEADLPAGRAEQMVRERTTQQQSAVVQPGAVQIPWMLVLGLGGVALWLLMRKK